MNNPKTFFGLAILGCALSSATAILGTIGLAGAGTGTAITLTALGASSGTTGYLTATGAALLGGAALLKAAALVTAANELRGKRSAEEEETEVELAVASIAANEPQQCYRRLICDLATGAMNSENEIIVSLFDKEVSPKSPSFDFVTAAKIGKHFRNVQYCEYRFSCPLTGAQIDKLF